MKYTGMLLQHHVHDLLAPYVPDGWEEAMESESTRPKRLNRKDRMVKMRDMQYTVKEQFFDGSQEADAEPENALLEEVGDGDEDGDYIPESD